MAKSYILGMPQWYCINYMIDCEDPMICSIYDIASYMYVACFMLAYNKASKSHYNVKGDRNINYNLVAMLIYSYILIEYCWWYYGYLISLLYNDD